MHFKKTLLHLRPLVQSFSAPREDLRQKRSQSLCFRILSVQQGAIIFLVRFACLSFAVTVGKYEQVFHNGHYDLAINPYPSRRYRSVGLWYNVPSCLQSTAHSCFATRKFSDNRSPLVCNVTTLSAHPSLIENCADRNTISRSNLHNGHYTMESIRWNLYDGIHTMEYTQ